MKANDSKYKTSLQPIAEDRTSSPDVTHAGHVNWPIPSVRILKAAELKTLFAETDDINVLLGLALYAFAGPRHRELEALHWDHLQTDTGVMLGALSARPRHIRILPVLDAWLHPFYGIQGPVLTRSLRRKLSRLAAKSGIPWGGNILRRSFGTHASVITGDPQRVAQQLGVPYHAYQRYHFSPVSRTESAEYFGLTPTAVGINNWPELVAAHLRKQRGRSTMAGGTAFQKSAASETSSSAPISPN